jgi:hypothetical protein
VGQDFKLQAFLESSKFVSTNVSRVSRVTCGIEIASSAAFRLKYYHLALEALRSG